MKTIKLVHNNKVYYAQTNGQSVIVQGKITQSLETYRNNGFIIEYI